MQTLKGTDGMLDCPLLETATPREALDGFGVGAWFRVGNLRDSRLEFLGTKALGLRGSIVSGFLKRMMKRHRW